MRICCLTITFSIDINRIINQIKYKSFKFQFFAEEIGRLVIAGHERPAQGPLDGQDVALELRETYFSGEIEVEQATRAQVGRLDASRQRIEHCP